MKAYCKYIFLFVLVASVCGCKDETYEIDCFDNQFANLPKTITVSLGNEDVSSRLAYEETNVGSLKALKSKWEADDVVYMNPYATASDGSNFYQLYATYKLKSGKDSSVGIFELDSENSFWDDRFTLKNYYLYYGGNVKNDSEFLNLSYDVQTQKGNDNMEHIEKLHVVRSAISFDSKTNFDEAFVNLSTNVDQPSCIKLELSNLPTSIIPTKVSLITLNTNNYWVDSFGKYNHLDSWVGSLSDNKNDKLHKLSLSLTNFSQTNAIVAYMMMSNRPVTLEEGSKLRVIVESGTKKYVADKLISNKKELKGGAYHILKINEGWNEYNVASSSDYTKDGIVTVKQNATAQGISRGVDLVFMGDGFIDADISNGTYTNALDQAYNDFFSVEPLRSLKTYFNVYYVNAVSENRQNVLVDSNDKNGATGTGVSTKFSTYFTPGDTGTGGNNDMVLEYAQKALGTEGRVGTAQMVVVINASCHAGTNHSYIDKSTDYGASWGIAYTPIGNPIDDTGEARRLTLVHEAAGHGVGKLADEYGGNTYYINPANEWYNLNLYHGWGYNRNVDKYDYTINESNVYWKDLIPTYKSPENLGVYYAGGAYTVSKDFCRPTDNSVMRSQFAKGGDVFNAASRWAIWYRIMKLTGKYSDPTVAEFITWDSQHPQTFTSRAANMLNPELDKLLPLAPPVYR